MQIDIHTETRFNRGDTIYWLGLNKLSTQYEVRHDRVREIGIRYTPEYCHIGYYTTFGQYIYDFAAFGSEEEVKEYYKNNQTITNIGYEN